MKYVSRIFLALGLASMLFGLIPFWQQPASWQGGGDVRLARTAERLLGGMFTGALMLCIAHYLAERSKKASSALRFSNVLNIIRRSRFCPKCGVPLCWKECTKKKQFLFVPLLLCPVCANRTEESGAVICAIALGLMTAATSVFLFYTPPPDADPGIVIMIAVVSFPLGICLFVMGLLQLDRQFRNCKNVN